MAGRIDLEIFSCEHMDGQFCTFKGELPSRAHDAVVLEKRFCNQSDSINKDDIKCNRAKITSTTIRSRVSKSGMMT